MSHLRRSSKAPRKPQDDEHAMALWQGTRKYPKAESFDHTFVSGFFAFPAFEERYGVLQSNGERIIPAVMQSGMGNAVNADEIIGLLLNGIIADRIAIFFAASIAMYLGAEILLGVPWILTLPLAIGIYIAPGSPWWLVRRGRTEDAGKALRKLRTKDIPEEHIADTLAMMLVPGSLPRFQPPPHRNHSTSFDFGMGEYSLAIIGVFIASAFPPKVGRRTLLLTGTFFMTATTFVIGFIGIPDMTKHTNLVYGIGLLIQYFVFFITVGPIVYTMVTEIPSNYLRTESVVLERACTTSTG
ncbi:Maltose permease MAL31-like protein 9 [Seiridium cupressi]